jgi:pimeloyl-ACP methyl ester carboxylesterase
MVHGSVATHTDWMRVAKLLANRYTCFAIDRRGRGKSGVGNSSYSIEREYEDIEAVLAAAGPGAVLAGHSFGAVCSLGVALRNRLPKLILYEPTLTFGGLVAGAPLADYARAIAANDPDGAMEIGLREFIRIDPEAIQTIRVSRAWPKLRSLARSWTRELQAMDDLQLKPEAYSAIDYPTLLIEGDQSPQHPMRNSVQILARVMPQARMETIAGHGHMALREVPETAARLIAAFLAE